MEFLRFGSSIPGKYWGCCAADVIQDFKQDPDEKASIEIVNGDEGCPITGKDGSLYAGMTYREIFHQRLRYGTFDTRDMPNHAFLAILEDKQIRTGHGAKWLPILKEAGFEFIRSVDNSVWNKTNHIFGLFRNVGPNSLKDQFTPPDVWTALPSVKPEAWEHNDAMVPLNGEVMTQHQKDADKKIWDALPPTKFYTEAELRAAGVPVWQAGRRKDENLQQIKPESAPAAKKSDPFGVDVVSAQPNEGKTFSFDIEAGPFHFQPSLPPVVTTSSTPIIGEICSCGDPSCTVDFG